ncbi:MAG: hypothetical protein WCD35_19465, partial [Mycobacteriales bacterium]
ALPALLGAPAGTAAPAPLAAGATSQRSVAGATPYGGVRTPDPLARLRATPALASCLAALTDPGDSSLPLALDYAAFEGKPALVVVLSTGKPDKVDVFVVGAGCAQPDAQLLFFTRLTRP